MTKRVIPYIVIGVAIMLGVLGYAWVMIDYRAFLGTPLKVGKQGVNYTLAPGTPLTRLADDLARRGVIKHPLYLILLARMRGDAQEIKAGEYHLAPGTTPGQLLNQLVAGKVMQYSLTLVDGWTFRQVMESVNRDPILVHTLRGLDDAAIMTRIGHPGENPEGRFYPDTYYFPRGTTDTAFLKRAHGRMQRFLAREWTHRAQGLPLKTPYDALILASIVEKETAVPAERYKIAGVFVRRLDIGMRLQTDPTVIYGLGKSYDGKLHARDLRRDTPYNTYLHAGLPPTPICMPSGQAIDAALHPAAGKALYFVARGNGTHQFSDTLAQHDKAIIKYLLHGQTEKKRIPHEGKIRHH